MPVAGSHAAGRLNYKVQKLNADKSPCTSGSPAYLDMVQRHRFKGWISS